MIAMERRILGLLNVEPLRAFASVYFAGPVYERSAEPVHPQNWLAGLKYAW